MGEEPQLWVDPHFLAASSQPTTRKPKATMARGAGPAEQLRAHSTPTGLTHTYRPGLPLPSQQLCPNLALLLFYLLQVLTAGGSHAGSSSFLPWSAYSMYLTNMHTHLYMLMHMYTWPKTGACILTRPCTHTINTPTCTHLNGHVQTLGLHCCVYPFMCIHTCTIPNMHSHMYYLNVLSHMYIPHTCTHTCMTSKQGYQRRSQLLGGF